MKTNYLMGILMIGFALTSCSQQTESSNPSPSPKPSAQPKNLITIEKAKEQLTNFNVAHPGVQGDQFALRTWISITELENYIAYVKEESRKKGIEVNGIDFMYTQYKQGKPNMPNLSNKEYDLTLMYAPTYLDGTSNIAFDPVHSEMDKPAKLSDLLGHSELTDSTNLKTEGITGDGQRGPSGGPSGIGNNVNSCPNMCP